MKPKPSNSLKEDPFVEQLHPDPVLANGFTNFDLKGSSLRYPFGRDRTEHSGQYQRPIQKTHFFFNKLLDSMDVGFNFLEDSEL
jgi:hypothetical protein